MIEQLVQIYGYLHGMWRYRWSALLITWVVALLGWGYVVSLPDQYSTKAVVYIDTTSVMKPLLKGLATETDSLDELKVMNRVLLSRDNLLTVMRETDMDLEVTSPEHRDSLVKSLAENIKVKGGGNGKRWEPKSNIYEIGYQSNSAERSYQVVSNLMNTMIEGTLNSTRTDSVTAQKFLDSQITEYERRLSVAEQQLADFKKANVGLMPDETGGYYARLQRAQDNAVKTRSTLILAERRYAELRKQLRGENPILDRGGYASSSAAKMRQYQEQLTVLLNQYTENHPDVQAVRSSIEDLKANKDIINSGGSIFSEDDEADVNFNPVYQSMKVDLSKAGVEVETLKIQLGDHLARVDKLKSSIDVIPEVEAKLSRLNRDYQVTRERYLSLVERRESALLAQNAEKSTSNITFRVIEPPIIPVRPSGPNRLLLLTAALAAALGAGLGWCYLRYLLQPTYIDLKQVRLKTGFPVLGYVSLFLTPQHKRKRQLQLISFLLATVLLTGVYGGIVYKVLL